MTTLERLVYGSTATGRTDNLMNVAAILAEAHRNNARDRVTGALAAHDNRYIQVIEGPTEALDDLLRRLGDDPRHRNIVVFGRETVATRMFADWTMASTRITPELATLLDDLMKDAVLSPEQAVRALKDAIAMT